MTVEMSKLRLPHLGIHVVQSAQARGPRTAPDILNFIPCTRRLTLLSACLYPLYASFHSAVRYCGRFICNTTLLAGLTCRHRLRLTLACSVRDHLSLPRTSCLRILSGQGRIRVGSNDAQSW